MKEDKGRPVVLVIVLLIIAIAVGGLYYLNHEKEGKDGKLVDEVNSNTKNGYNYKLLSTKNNFEIKYHKYIIEYNGEKGVLYKICDMEGNVIFEGEQPYNEFVIGVDKKMYVYKEDAGDFDNTITLYELKDKEFEEVTKYHEKGEFVVPIKLEENNDNSGTIMYDDDFDLYLLGFYVENGSSSSDGNILAHDSYYYPLNGEKKELKGMTFKGDSARLEATQAIITHDKDYISYSIPNPKKKGFLHGLYSLKDSKVVIEAAYEGIYYSKKNTYIVENDKKSGIIDVTGKKLVNIEYDFIDDNGEYYVVSKNNKMAIMNKDYKVITDYFLKYPGGEYDYETCCANSNSFVLSQFGDKYLFFADYDYLGYSQEDSSDTPKESKNEIYIVNKDYSLKKISGNHYHESSDLKTVFVESRKENKVYVYDDYLNLKFEIDLNKYDAKTDDIYFEVEGNVIYDLEADLYFDLKTGKELEDHKLTRDIGNVKLVLDEDHVDILLDNEKVHSIKTEYVLPVSKFSKGFYIYYQSDPDKDEIAIFTKK